MDWILEPWPWYISGPLIALIMFILLYAGKFFGMSSNMRTLCTIAGADKTSSFFKIDLKAQRWNLLVMIGVAIGGFLSSNFLTISEAPGINEKTISKLNNLGIHSAGESYVPTELYGNQIFSEPKIITLLLLGGLLVGFGARYAGGCTSGHSISGISNLQLPSLIATIGFFAGGLLMVHFIFPLIF